MYIYKDLHNIYNIYIYIYMTCILDVLQMIEEANTSWITLFKYSFLTFF